MFNRKNRRRKMKKIFQWEEYLNWKNMSKEQKLNFKRACLFPFLVYMVYVFLNEYSLAILLLLGLYFSSSFFTIKHNFINIVLMILILINKINLQ